MSAILAVAVCAVVSGSRSFTAIGEWAADASADVLTRLGIAGNPPGESTIRRVLQRMNGDELDAVLGNWLAARTGRGDQRRALAVDGKTLRGSAGQHTRARHLMAAIDHGSSTVLAQVTVDEKTNEIPLFAPLCDTITTMAGTVVTVDALHCQRPHAEHLVAERGAHYVVTVKGNQPGLHHQLTALPWNKVPAGHTSTDRAHGRVEKRSLKIVSIAAGIDFPHAAQAIQITRTTRPLTSRKWSREVVYAITSLPAKHTSPAELAGYLRGHWRIENRLHWVRDVTFAEDHSQVRTGNGPHVMASLRNLVISLLRLARVTNIAQALRHHARNPHRPLALLQMTS